MRRSNDYRWQSLAAETVSLKHSVMRNQPQFFHAGLCDEHPIKRIAVYGGQATNRYSVPKPDR
jgi:hypothetical protein